MYQSDTTKLYYVYYCIRATCFDCYRIIFRPCTLEGPEDDSIRIETCCPNTIINIIKFCCVWLIHHCIFIYVSSLGFRCFSIWRRVSGQSNPDVSTQRSVLISKDRQVLSEDPAVPRKVWFRSRSTGTVLYAGTTDFSVLCKCVAWRGLMHHRHVTKYGSEGGSSYMRLVNLAANNTWVYIASQHDPPPRKTSL